MTVSSDGRESSCLLLRGGESITAVWASFDEAALGIADCDAGAAAVATDAACSDGCSCLVGVLPNSMAANGTAMEPRSTAIQIDRRGHLKCDAILSSPMPIKQRAAEVAMV
jgi:hypothetical protein